MGVYYCPGTKAYGNLQPGTYITEATAVQSGYQPSLHQPTEFLVDCSDTWLASTNSPWRRSAPRHTSSKNSALVTAPKKMTNVRHKLTLKELAKSRKRVNWRGLTQSKFRSEAVISFQLTPRRATRGLISKSEPMGRMLYTNNAAVFNLSTDSCRHPPVVLFSVAFHVSECP